MMRKDILEAVAEVKDMIFPIFTNGTLIGPAYLEFLRKHLNMVPIIRIEGTAIGTDERRGQGVFRRAMQSTEIETHDTHSVIFPLKTNNITFIFVSLQPKGCERQRVGDRRSGMTAHARPSMQASWRSLNRSFVTRNVSNIIIMTTIELKTSIAADLDQMSVEMLESVSRYVRRLRHRSRNGKPQTATSLQRRREAAMLFVKNLSVSGGHPVPSDERGIDALITEKYDK